jgi:hypothetical protein
MQPLLDLGQSSPRALSPERMSNECAKLLIEDLLLGDFAFNMWQAEFLSDVGKQSFYTLDQKKVIYNLAHKFRIL